MLFNVYFTDKEISVYACLCVYVCVLNRCHCIKNVKERERTLSLAKGRKVILTL